MDSAWIADNRVDERTEVPVKVFLRPFRGERIERELKVKIPAGLPRGEHQILFSDAETLDKFQTIASSLNHFMDIRKTVAMLNQQRANNRLYVSILESQPTVYSDEKVLPNLPPSVLNVTAIGTGHQSSIRECSTKHDRTNIRAVRCCCGRQYVAQNLRQIIASK